MMASKKWGWSPAFSTRLERPEVKSDSRFPVSHGKEIQPACQIQWDYAGSSHRLEKWLVTATRSGLNSIQIDWQFAFRCKSGREQAARLLKPRLGKVDHGKSGSLGRSGPTPPGLPAPEGGSSEPPGRLEGELPPPGDVPPPLGAFPLPAGIFPPRTPLIPPVGLTRSTITSCGGLFRSVLSPAQMCSPVFEADRPPGCGCRTSTVRVGHLPGVAARAFARYCSAGT